MESGALGVEPSSAADPRVQSDSKVACLRRRAWAQSRDSVWQESGPETCGPQEPQQNQQEAAAQGPSGEPGRVPNNIASWLIECRTPLGASLDDQSASPSRGALRNGCSFEDDLSLGAEANHLQSSNNKTESCFGLVADQKRSQFKERGRSMNSTGSGKSSTVSSVSELLDLYEEDPEEILLNLGFGREEPDLGSRVPSRFFNSSSTARGIDIKVYLGAQLQRMELENPNYALTSRFRQIEVLTTVANEFFNLYSQVSGQSVQRISSKDQGGGEGEEEGEKENSPPPLKKTSSARNMAKLLKKTITRHNLNAAAPESPETPTLVQQTQQNGHAASDHTHTNGHAEQDGCSSDPDHQGDAVNQKHNWKKDVRSLATVTEETSGDGETEESPEQSSAEPAADGKPPPEDEKNLTSTPEKTPHALAPPQLAQLRNENADSFDMEEIQSNEDEAVPSRSSRGSDLLRTVSQQSDSSGFAEEPSADSNSYLKVQESSDSCDSETTVTSHPSQDLATPLALDHPAFILPDVKEGEAGPGAAAGADGRSNSREEDEHDGISEVIPQYTAHQLPKKSPTGAQQDQEQVQNGEGTDPESELNPESQFAADQAPQTETENTQNLSATEPEPSQNQTETSAEPTEGAGSESQEGQAVLDDSDLVFPPPPPSPVESALNRAKQHQLSRAGISPSAELVRGRGRGRGVPLQRSSSLPSSLLSPSKIVSSVRIQFGRGHASCTQPRYSFRYTQEDGEEHEEHVEGGDQEEEGQTSCRSTLIINPASSSDSNQPSRLPTDSVPPPKPIPRYLTRSSYSLQSSSPPPDWPADDNAHSWSTQSVPDLSSNRPQQQGQFQQNLGSNQNQQSWTPPMTFPNPHPQPAPQFLNPPPNPGARLNPSPYPYTPPPPPQYPTPVHPYSSLPNLHPQHSPSFLHHSSLTGLHSPSTPPFPTHASLSNLHHPPPSMTPHHASMGNLHPATPMMHHQGYSTPYAHHSPYFSPPHTSPYSSSYLGYQGYNMSPHLGYPPLAPDPGFHPGLAPPAPGLHPGLYPGMFPPAPSSTEMQLRRVLHEIRGTVQSLSQNRADTPDAFIEHRAAPSSNQSLAEFQQKRRSLNLFRSQMMDLELSIIRQQAVVYKHLSPADRLELEQLQSLRSAVREELQELEQQLEDRLLELTQQGGLHRDASVDNLCTASALRAMEPVSDLLREQLYLQSELSYDGHAPSRHSSTRSSSPVQGEDHEQSQGVYRASINITPALPPRPHAPGEEDEEEETERQGGGGRGEEEGAAGGLGVDNLQELIREIRESVAKEVRREIYSELLATVSPQRSSLPARQQPL